MRLNKRKVHIVSFSVTAICILLVSVVLLYPKPEVPPPDASAAIEKAISVFEEGTGNTYALLFLDIIYRRFGIDEFSNSLQRYDQAIENNSDYAPLFRLFRRIADRDNPLQTDDLNMVTAQCDMITIPALYCDVVGVPDNYWDILQEAVDGGGYLVTHVLLALVWMKENGFATNLPYGFEDTVYKANAELIDDTDPEVYDIELEAAAFLCLAGKMDLIDNSFANLVLDAQQSDGTWGHSSTDRWHTTVLGLLYLLHLEYPSDSYPPSLASA